MTFREELIESIKGKPGSLTSQAFNTGVIVERERIIKLLEEHRNDFSVHRGFGEIENLADDAIALIKEENK